jgi:hypothetical protein
MLEVRRPEGYTCEISPDLARDRKDYREEK